MTRSGRGLRWSGSEQTRSTASPTSAAVWLAYIDTSSGCSGSEQRLPSTLFTIDYCNFAALKRTVDYFEVCALLLLERLHVTVAAVAEHLDLAAHPHLLLALVPHHPQLHSLVSRGVPAANQR